MKGLGDSRVMGRQQFVHQSFSTPPMRIDYKDQFKYEDAESATSADGETETETFNRDMFGRFAASRSPSRGVGANVEQSLDGSDPPPIDSSESFGQPGELKEAIDALAAVRRGN